MATSLYCNRFGNPRILTLSPFSAWSIGSSFQERSHRKGTLCTLHPGFWVPLTHCIPLYWLTPNNYSKVKVAKFEPPSLARRQGSSTTMFQPVLQVRLISIQLNTPRKSRTKRPNMQELVTGFPYLWRFLASRIWWWWIMKLQTHVELGTGNFLHGLIEWKGVQHAFFSSLSYRVPRYHVINCNHVIM